MKRFLGQLDCVIPFISIYFFSLNKTPISYSVDEPLEDSIVFWFFSVVELRSEPFSPWPCRRRRVGKVFFWKEKKI
jgi:hypothetical protein